MPAKPNLVKANFDLDRETKGAVRYQERGEDDSQAIRTLYLRKTALNGDVPEAIEVTIKVIS